ncbi:MAG: hypothetical protein IJ019_05735 [Alphaproteobacteria bacterium]|nr:hypothetical protein [Alphaproteobacteria bacterium]
MKKREEIYKSIIKENLSIRVAARILKIAPTTAYDRIKKIKKQDNLIHGNTGKTNRKSQANKG